ncbi:MAG TPA: MarR family transcriptional regulator [Acidimicrobiales bacterium]|nr:MarR family transcriptional regulator [Acidimicrobiales bacterium]
MISAGRSGSTGRGGGTGRGDSAAREAWRLLAEMWFSDEMHDRFHAACEAADISPPQLKALLSLEPGQVRSMRALAQTWKCDASWVTGIVDGLEARGYAERQLHTTDRRVKVVAITRLGEKAKARALDCLYEPPAAWSELPLAEQRTLRDLLAKVQRTGPNG